MASPRQQALMKRYLWRLVEVVSLLCLVSITALLFVWLMPYILPFVAGAFFAILLWPLVRWLERRGMPRTLAVTVVMAGIVLLFVALSIYVVVQVAREAALWSSSVPMYFNEVQAWLAQQIELGRAWYGQLPPSVTNQIESAASEAVTSVETFFSGLASWVIDSVTKLPESLFVTAVALIATFFMLVHRERMVRGFLRLLPPGWGDKVQVVAGDMMRAFLGTLRVQVVLMLMSAVLGVIGMWIAGIKYAVILGILFGLTGLVPVVGSAIMTVPWMLGALLIGDVALALKVLVIQLAISLIRHLVEPKILAESVGLDTLSTLFALYVGMKLMGVLGLFLGPIVLIGIKSLLRIRLLVDFLPIPEVEKEPAQEPAQAQDRKGEPAR
ncbi:sporulation integral membrane protein YtvI [Alicyclobacillus macrosporangiidus]|uniref:sporulation integral membrane protein YtvI n=1 Tax=Alicyclobacillus macrosporangiidus TaxID=392015 RepID=UPI001E3A1DC3|nr:sporulation integral membrane protein YtvI [Alicyclobacillus macrosporangiidus]